MDPSDTDELIMGIDLTTWRARIGFHMCRPLQMRWKSSGGRLCHPGVASFRVGELMTDTPLVVVIALLLVIAGDVETNPGPAGINFVCNKTCCYHKSSN